MQSSDPTVPFRAGLYCILPSEYSCTSFVRAAKIYSSLRNRDEIEDLSLNDNWKRPDSIDVKRQALYLLLMALNYEDVYNEILQSQDMLPSVLNEETQYLAFILLHDMRKRLMLPGIINQKGDPVIKCLEELFNNKRLSIWSKFSDICTKRNVMDIEDLSSSKYSVICEDRKSPTMAWVNTNKCDIDSLITSLRMSGYDIKKCRTDSEMILDLPNVVFICQEDVKKLSQNPAIKNHQLVIHDTLGCLGPHCFVNIVLQHTRVSNGLTLFSDRRRSFHSKSDEHVYPKLKGFDVLVAEAKNCLQLAHLGVLLQLYGFDGSILAFNVGSEAKKKYYKRLLRRMKIQNVQLYGIKVTELHPIDKRLKNVLAAYINPPCSHSAVTNLVDFLSVEEADFHLLQDIYHENCHDYVDGQQELMRYCLSLPQIKLALYVTNSIGEMENESVVHSVIKDMMFSKSNGAGDVMNLKTFEVTSIPISAEGFQKSSITSIKISPNIGRNGCYICPITRKFQTPGLIESDTDSFELSSEIPVLHETGYSEEHNLISTSTSIPLTNHIEESPHNNANHRRLSVLSIQSCCIPNLEAAIYEKPILEANEADQNKFLEKTPSEEAVTKRDSATNMKEFQKMQLNASYICATESKESLPCVHDDNFHAVTRNIGQPNSCVNAKLACAEKILADKFPSSHYAYDGSTVDHCYKAKSKKLTHQISNKSAKKTTVNRDGTAKMLKPQVFDNHLFSQKNVTQVNDNKKIALPHTLNKKQSLTDATSRKSRTLLFQTIHSPNKPNYQKQDFSFISSKYNTLKNNSETKGYKDSRNQKKTPCLTNNSNQAKINLPLRIVEMDFALLTTQIQQVKNYNTSKCPFLFPDVQKSPDEF